MKVNSGQAPSTLIPEYVGSDFDAVLEVASNIDAVLEVVSNIEAVKAVAAHKTATELADGFMSSADKIKLDGIAAGANNYTHPVSAVTAGTYKSVSVDVNGHITAGTNPTTLAGFGITDGVPLSHVGAGGTAHSEASTSVAGFMSAADKTKLDGIAAGANAYVHPTGDGNLHVPITGTYSDGYVLKAGATAGSLKWAAISKTDVGLSNVDNTSDLDKPVSTATANALSDKAPISHVGSVGEEHHGLASQAIAGFMSPTDKIKLDNITGVTAVTGVSSVNNKTGEVALTKADVGLGLVNNTADLAKPVSTATQTALDAKADTNHVHEAVTTSVAGFMSSADKTKLDGVAAGATKNSTDAYLLNRANHTGTQDTSTITGLDTTLSTINTGLAGKLDKAGGVISGPITENIPTATYTYIGDNITSITENYLGGVKTTSFQYTGDNITRMIEQYAGSTTTTTYVYDESGNLVSSSATYA